MLPERLQTRKNAQINPIGRKYESSHGGMTNEITTPRALYKLQKCRPNHQLQQQKATTTTENTITRARNGEVRQIRAGVRSCFHPHFQPSHRRLVQAVDRSKLLFGWESVGFAVGHPEVAVCAPVWGGISAGQRRDSRGLQQRPGGAQQQQQRQTDSSAEEHGDLRKGHFPKPTELRAASGRFELVSLQSRRVSVARLSGLLHLMSGAGPFPPRPESLPFQECLPPRQPDVLLTLNVYQIHTREINAAPEHLLSCKTSLLYTWWRLLWLTF